MIEPDVDMSRNLHERLHEDAIDVIVIPRLSPVPRSPLCTLVMSRMPGWRDRGSSSNDTLSRLKS